MDVGELGDMSFVSDPGGAAIGAWQPKLFQGFGILSEAGAPSWFELLTRDYEDAVAVYRRVSRWDAHTVSDAPGFRMTTLGQATKRWPGSWMLPGSFPRAFLPTGWSTSESTTPTRRRSGVLLASGSDIFRCLTAFDMPH